MLTFHILNVYVRHVIGENKNQRQHFPKVKNVQRRDIAPPPVFPFAPTPCLDGGMQH